MKDGRIVEVTEVVGVEGSSVLFERYRPPHDTVLKRYRVAEPIHRSGRRKWCKFHVDCVVQAHVRNLDRVQAGIYPEQGRIRSRHAVLQLHDHQGGHICSRTPRSTVTFIVILTQSSVKTLEPADARRCGLPGPKLGSPYGRRSQLLCAGPMVFGRRVETQIIMHL